jgi:hypothetical protein
MLSGCGDNMSKLAKDNPELSQVVIRLSKCAGVMFASGQIANGEMMRQNSQQLISFTAIQAASYGVTEKDLWKIADVEAKKWQSTTINNTKELQSELNNCSFYMRSITNTQ